MSDADSAMDELRKHPSRFVRRGMYDICKTCGMACDYCPCHVTAPDAPPKDGTESTLQQRVNEVKR